MKAVVLAAGIGSRLYPLTQNKPKALLELNGRTLLDRMTSQLVKEGVREFIVVTGYCDDAVKKELRNIAARRPDLDMREVKNPVYNTTGTAYSLWLSLPYWDDDLLIVEGDLVVEKALVKKLCRTQADAFLLTDFGAHLGPEEMKVRSRGGAIEAISKKLDPGEAHGEYIGMGRFRGAVLASFSARLDALVRDGGKNEFYEAAIEAMAGEHRVEVLDTEGRPWTEIDFAADYEKARAIFWEERKNRTVRTDLFGKTSHSPSLQALFQDFDALHVHDFCYLANPFFPPEGFTREIRMKLDLLLRAYPSLNRDIAEKVSHLTGLDPDGIVVGNGATELIDHITRLFVRRLTLPVPTFSEYIETAEKHGREVRTVPGRAEDAFRLSPEAFVSAVRSSGSDAAVIINPDNPSGQYLPVTELRAVLEQLEGLGLVVVDESFSDFASIDTPPSAVNLLEQHPNLIVIKSLGKIFGLPGLRLGYAVTAHPERAAELRRQLPVWNANAVAEFFLDRLPDYQKDYEISRVKVIACTRALRERLDRIEGVQAFPSATNFVLLRLTAGGWTSTRLRDELLTHHNIYVRDCSNKTGLDDSYVRVACRTEEENRLVADRIEAVLHGRPAAGENGDA